MSEQRGVQNRKSKPKTVQGKLHRRKSKLRSETKNVQTNRDPTVEANRKLQEVRQLTIYKRQVGRKLEVGKQTMAGS